MRLRGNGDYYPPPIQDQTGLLVWISHTLGRVEQRLEAGDIFHQEMRGFRQETRDQLSDLKDRITQVERLPPPEKEKRRASEIAGEFAEILKDLTPLLLLIGAMIARLCGIDFSPSGN